MAEGREGRFESLPSDGKAVERFGYPLIAATGDRSRQEYLHGGTS
jgi:hypothetical protein